MFFYIFNPPPYTRPLSNLLTINRPSHIDGSDNVTGQYGIEKMDRAQFQFLYNLLVRHIMAILARCVNIYLNCLISQSQGSLEPPFAPLNPCFCAIFVHHIHITPT